MSSSATSPGRPKNLSLLRPGMSPFSASSWARKHMTWRVETLTSERTSRNSSLRSWMASSLVSTPGWGT